MSLKDWKIVINNELVTWRRKKEDMFLTLFRQDYDPDAYGYNKPTDYRVTVGTHSDKTVDKSFKTKSKATRFAKEYMKEN